MALTVGTRLGAYEVLAQIGVGGMGEVYRAADAKLKRQVALKILPTSLATGSETKLFAGRYYTGAGVASTRHYDVSSDGQRFVMIKEGGTDQTAAPPQVIVVQHWAEELKRLVPIK